MPHRTLRELLHIVTTNIKHCLDTKGDEHIAALRALSDTWEQARPHLEVLPATFLKLRAFAVAIALVEQRSVEHAHDLVYRFAVAEQGGAWDHDLELLKSVFLRHCPLFAAVYDEITEEISR